MFKLTKFLFLFILFTKAFGQTNHQNTKSTLLQQTQKVNTLLKKYSKLSPFSNNEDRFDIIDSIREQITTRIIKILNSPNIYHYPIEKLFVKDELIISKSADNKIYLFSIDQKTGGSFHTYETIILYKLANGKPKADFFIKDPDDLLANSTYGDIYVLDDKTQKYFVMASVQTCNTCVVSSAITLQIVKDAIKTELVVRNDGRSENLMAFDYDPKQKEFIYEYQSTDEDGKITKSHHFKYRYQNGVFSKVKKSQKSKKTN